MYKFIIVFFLLSSGLSHAQTNPVINNIDLELNKCLIDSSGVTGQKYCLDKATENWKNLIKKQYDLLLTLLPDKEKQSLKDVHKKWEEYSNYEVELSEKIQNCYYSKNPAIIVYPQIASEIKMNLLKNRALELKKYCDLILND